MMHEGTNELLRRLLELTKQRRLSWKKDDNGWCSTSADRRTICFRLLFYEATNQVGSDPRFVEFSMPGVNRCFAMGTEGADLLFELLGAANLGFPSSDAISQGLQAAHSILDTVEQEVDKGDKSN